jgi:O-6-methylguanine DNA methyltransferase
LCRIFGAAEIDPFLLGVGAFIFEIARSEWYLKGQLPLQTLRADIDYAFTEAFTTYGQIARKLNTKAYRAVGNACRKNPYAPRVPCHRVVRSDGTIGGFGGKTSWKECGREDAATARGKVEIDAHNTPPASLVFYDIKESE